MGDTTGVAVWDSQPSSNIVVIDHLVVEVGVGLEDVPGEACQGQEQEEEHELNLVETFPRVSAATGHIKALEPGFLHDDASEEPSVLCANGLACTSVQVFGRPACHSLLGMFKTYGGPKPVQF